MARPAGPSTMASMSGVPSTWAVWARRDDDVEWASRPIGVAGAACHRPGRGPASLRAGRVAHRPWPRGSRTHRQFSHRRAPCRRGATTGLVESSRARITTPRLGPCRPWRCEFLDVGTAREGAVTAIARWPSPCRRPGPCRGMPRCGAQRVTRPFTGGWPADDGNRAANVVRWKSVDCSWSGGS